MAPSAQDLVRSQNRNATPSTHRQPFLSLEEFIKLQSGDWIAQNSANSGVGRAVIAFAKARGLKTVNLVRRPGLVPEPKAIGADVVPVSGPYTVAEVAAATEGAGKDHAAYPDGSYPR